MKIPESRMPDQSPGFHRMSDKPPASGWDQEVFEHQMGLVLERVDEVARAALTPQAVADAVSAGIKAALADPTTWTAAAGGARASTEKHAGQWMVSTLWSVVRKAFWFTLAGLVVYSVGGWSALSALWKAVWGSQP